MRNLLLPLISAVLLIANTCGAEPPEGEASPAPILVDWIHANDFSMIGLRPETFEYHLTAGFRHGFEYLESRGRGLEYTAAPPLTLERLRQHKLLFINLVSAEREPFLVSEIAAIRAFVEQGGSLLVITDHTNCYFHAHRLKPLFTELDIESPVVTACDRAPHAIGEGNGWITISDFREHPITRGLERIAFQTGGRVDPRFAVAWTSERSWADQWQYGLYGDEHAPGFYGDFEQNPDEPSGPLGVVLAKELGRGRIVVVADQNIFSDGFINYADNYRLWLNLFSWLLHEPDLANPTPYVERDRPRILLFEPREKPTFGEDGPNGRFHLAALVTRFFWTFIDDRPLGDEDLIILPHDDVALNDARCDALTSHLRSGKNILVLETIHGDDFLERGAIAAIVEAMGVKPVVDDADPNSTVLSFPGQGRIVVRREPRGLTNKDIANPTVVPNAEQHNQNGAILERIRAVLPSRERSE